MLARKFYTDLHDIEKALKVLETDFNSTVQRSLKKSQNLISLSTGEKILDSYFKEINRLSSLLENANQYKMSVMSLAFAKSELDKINKRIAKLEVDIFSLKTKIELQINANMHLKKELAAKNEASKKPSSTSFCRFFATHKTDIAAITVGLVTTTTVLTCAYAYNKFGK